MVSKTPYLALHGEGYYNHKGLRGNGGMVRTYDGNLNHIILHCNVNINLILLLAIHLVHHIIFLYALVRDPQNPLIKTE
jgi:hypothetical protein